MPGVPGDALGQVKRGLRSLFSRRKKKKQREPTPSSDAPTQTTPAAAAAPAEAPATSNRNIEDATENEQPPAPPPHPAAAPTPSTAATLAPDPPPVTTTAATSSDLAASRPSERQPHISAPSQIEEAKEIDLNPQDVKTEASAVIPASGDLRPKPKPEETGMSATSGPMGDHMAEVWRDSDVGVKEGRPVELEGDAVGIAEGLEGGKGEGEMF